MNNVLLGGLLTLGGVLIGGLITLATESLRHKWFISDRNYQRKKEIVDKRCEEAETYAHAATADFRHFMDMSTSLLLGESDAVMQTSEERRQWLKELDKKTFSLGPSILALSDDQLIQSWGKIANTIDKIRAIYIRIHQNRLNHATPMYDKDNLQAQISSAWSEYSQELGVFYKRIDIIRYERSEK